MTRRLPPYPDHMFGDLDLPRRAVPYLLKHSQRIQHAGRKNPPIPRAGEPLLLEVTTSADLPAGHVSLIYSTDDWATRAELPFGPAAPLWQTLGWSFLRGWQLLLPPQTAGTLLRYKICAALPGGMLCFADNHAATFEHATSFALYYDPAPYPPHWAASARIAQIFVDRFNPGEGRDWLQTADLLKPFGGTLRGVTEKLGYLAGLGFNAIWLTPIFKSPSHHGYDTSDYEQIEPRLGTQAELEALLQQAHARGMHVILDFVANHVSEQHPALQASLHDEADPHHSWFRWKPWPRYEGYFGLSHMPNLNLAWGSPARAHLLAVAQKWLSLGVDGYRLDYANGPEPDFWVDFRRACRQINPECWTFGELTLPADVQRSFGGGMDGALDFLTCQALRETFGQRRWSLARLAGFLQGAQDYFPPEFSRPAFIDNHDMNRFLFMAQGEQRALHAALTLLYLLPGAPIVYYGTESGLSQRAGIHDRGAHGLDEARLAMNWEQEGRGPTAGLLRQLSAFREANPWLARARWQLLELDEGGQSALFSLNAPGGSLRVSVDLSSRGEWVSF